ncbi:MAG: VOC family protein [Myxococcales bacterium]
MAAANAGAPSAHRLSPGSTILKAWSPKKTLRKQLGGVKVLFVAGFGPIVREAAASRGLYAEALDIRLKEEAGGYLHTEGLEGVKTFALWSLSQAVQSCFGEDSWPDEVPAPQAWLEFDVDSVERATAALAARGYPMLVENKKEPWGQVVSRLLSREGLLLGITLTPSLR